MNSSHFARKLDIGTLESTWKTTWPPIFARLTVHNAWQSQAQLYYHGQAWGVHVYWSYVDHNHLAPTFFSNASIVKLLGRSMGSPKARDHTPCMRAVVLLYIATWQTPATLCCKCLLRIGHASIDTVVLTKLDSAHAMVGGWWDYGNETVATRPWQWDCSNEVVATASIWTEHSYSPEIVHQSLWILQTILYRSWTRSCRSTVAAHRCVHPHWAKGSSPALLCHTCCLFTIISDGLHIVK